MRITLPSALAKHRNVYIGIAVVVLLAVSGSIFAISRDGNKAKAKPAATVYELAAADVFKLQPRALAQGLRLSGTLSPVRHAVVKSHSTGNVLEIRVQEGDRVRRGDLLVKIDPRSPQAEKDSRNAALNKARADLILATKNRDNSVVLLDRKLISQNAFDQTVATFEASAANEQAAAAQLRMAEIALQDTEIRAEFDGVVATRKAQVGERVLPDSMLLSIVDLAQMQLEALVPVADVPGVRVGMPAHFKVDGFGDRQFAGQVGRINPQTEQGSRSLSIYVSVANTDGALRGGMFAEGDLVLKQTAPILAVPAAAIYSENGSEYVLVVDNGLVTRRDITRGAAFPDLELIAVDRGLNPDAQVIVTRATTLKPGVAVKLAST